MDDDLKDLAPILKALQKLSEDRTTYRRTLEQVDAQFSLLLTEETRKQEKTTDRLINHGFRIGQTVLSAIRPPRTNEELLRRIQQACELSDKQVRLLSDIGLVSADETGRPILRNRGDVLLTHEKASAYLFVIGCLLGMAIMSIVLEPTPSFWLVIRGLGLGMAIGSTAGFVLGRSFRAYPILERLENLDPWLNAQNSARS